MHGLTFFFRKKKRYILTLEKRVAELEKQSKEKDEILKALQPAEALPELSMAREVSDRYTVTDELSASTLLKIFEKLNHVLSQDALLEKAKVAADEAQQASDLFDESEVHRVRFSAIEKVVQQHENEVWVSYGISPQKAAQVLSSDDYGLSEEVPQDIEMSLEEAMITFNEIKSRLVIVAAIGQAAYERNQREEAEMHAVTHEIQEKLSLSDVNARQAYLEKVRKDANEIFKNKLSAAKDPKQMDTIFESLPSEERMTIMKAQAIQQLMGVGSHGHSHDGVPCGGHGHSHQQQQHGHSHDGKPCHGHGEPGDEEEYEEGEYVDDDDEDLEHGHSHHSHPGHGHSH